MTPQRVSPLKVLLTLPFSVAFAACLALLFASPVSAQNEDATATLGGAGCDGDNVELVISTTAGEALVTQNASPEGGDWEMMVSIPARNEPVIASATCFSGDVPLVNYSPISLRVQPGVEVGGVIELPANPIEGAAAQTAATDTPATPEALPETGPYTVGLTALAVALIAAGLGMAFVSNQMRTVSPVAVNRNSGWMSSHWDRNEG